MSFLKKVSTLLAVNIFILLAISLTSCGLKPLAWETPAKPAFEEALALNDKLQSSDIISLKGNYGPEDIVMDEAGNLFCGVHATASDFSEGRILKISPKGEVEVFYEAGSWVAGLHFDAEMKLVALSHRQGLIRIDSEGQVEVLADRDEKGRPFLIPNGLDIASDGMIYFSNTSHEAPYTLKYGRKLILEMRPQGGLYAYNPQTSQVTTLIDGTYFGNGVVLSQKEDYLLMTETTRYRILRYDLKGEHAGEVQVFMDNLPGFPNGISIREDGTYWLGFSTVRNDALDNIHPKAGMKKMIYSMPEFLQPKQELFGMVLNISQSGEILQAVYDPTGEKVPEAGSVKEYQGKLYLGGDVVPHISVYDLAQNSENFGAKQ